MTEAVAPRAEIAAPARGDLEVRLKRAAEAIVVPLVALLAATALFSVFLLLLGKSPADFFALVAQGAFASWFSLQNTLQRAAPLLLTALCCAIPARLGLVVIGGEGALALGGLAAAAAGIAMTGAGGTTAQLVMVGASLVVGGAWIGLVGALRHWRGINETISSLILSYIAIALMNHFVEGPLKDPASLNKPSTAAIPDVAAIGTIPGTDVHWGLVIGVGLCVVLWVLMSRTTFGFAARIVGGNLRAAQLQGLPVGRLILIASAIGGACAGLAGMIEVAAVHGRANASLVVGYGYTGILVAFLARHNPLAVIPVAILFGGIVASGGLIQRRMGLPDATILVLEGIVFVAILVSDTLYGRWRIFQPRATAP
ncbi:MAG: ABC transporter permease [Proteobacteria bacterium]|nr:ABC transporter permease [Pseudomonadota bacterium]